MMSDNQKGPIHHNPPSIQIEGSDQVTCNNQNFSVCGILKSACSESSTETKLITNEQAKVRIFSKKKMLLYLGFSSKSDSSETAEVQLRYNTQFNSSPPLASDYKAISVSQRTSFSSDSVEALDISIGSIRNSPRQKCVQWNNAIEQINDLCTETGRSTKSPRATLDSLAANSCKSTATIGVTNNSRNSARASLTRLSTPAQHDVIKAAEAPTNPATSRHTSSVPSGKAPLNRSNTVPQTNKEKQVSDVLHTEKLNYYKHILTATSQIVAEDENHYYVLTCGEQPDQSNAKTGLSESKSRDSNNASSSSSPTTTAHQFPQPQQLSNGSPRMTSGFTRTPSYIRTSPVPTLRGLPPSPQSKQKSAPVTADGYTSSNSSSPTSIISGIAIPPSSSSCTNSEKSNDIYDVNEGKDMTPAAVAESSFISISSVWPFFTLG